MKIIRHVPLLLCFCVGQALADTPIDLHHPASATVHVSISNVKGEVSVIGWNRNEVQVSGQLGNGAQPLTITGNNDALNIEVKPQGKSGLFSWGGDNAMASSELKLHVPKAATLSVNVVSAPLLIDDTDGGGIDVHSVSGRVRINAQTPSLTVNSVSGNVELAGHAEHSELQTVSGDILAPVLGSKAKLQTISGQIQASGGPWQTLDLSTVSGDVQLAGKPAPDGALGINSMSGDVQLQLPADTSATLHAKSFSGDLRSDFGTPKEPQHGPGSSLDTRIGDGHGKIDIETFSGDLRIRRK